MSNKERPNMLKLDEIDLAQIDARKKDNAEALPKMNDILGKHTKYPETLEGMFGKEKAARMRREAEIVDLATPEESKH